MDEICIYLTCAQAQLSLPVYSSLGKMRGATRLAQFAEQTKLVGGCRASSQRAACAGARHYSDFSYVTPGRVQPRVHEVTFDESQRGEQWKSDTIPRVPFNSGKPSTSTQRAAALMQLRKQHPETFLVHAYKYVEEQKFGPIPLSADQLAPLLAAPTEAERAAASTEAGRTQLMAQAREERRQLHAQTQTAQQLFADAGLASLPVPEDVRSKLISACRRDLHLGTMKALRASSIAQHVAIAALPASQAGEAEAAWLATLGIGPAAAPSRSPRVPADSFSIIDNPLEAPQTLEERRNDNHEHDEALTRRLAMEHRDRAEFLPRRRLPTPLHADAPTRDLEQVARVLESNRSLSQQDREYMMRIWTTAVTQKPEEVSINNPLPLLSKDEYAAWFDPQPQWGYYDPALPVLQDDVDDAMKQRGQFSTYRGLTYKEAQMHPSSYGAAGLPGVAPGTPLETTEEVSLSSASVEMRLAAESREAEEAVTATLRRQMGLPVFPSKASSGATKPTFFARLAAGEVEPKPEAPVKAVRIERPRKEVAAAAPAKGGKGGKPAPAAAAKKK